MQSSASIVELSKALCAAQGEFKGVEKGGHNTYDNYNYAKLENFITAATPVLTKNGLSVLCSVEEVIALEARQTQGGATQQAVRVKVMLRLMHVSGEWIETPCFGEGQDRSDKSVYKAITGARKYALASALGLATTDDPENDDGGKQPPQAPAKPQARQPAAAPKPPAKTPTPEERAKIEFMECWLNETTRLGVDPKRARIVLSEVGKRTRQRMTGKPDAEIYKKILDDLATGAFTAALVPPKA